MRVIPWDCESASAQTKKLIVSWRLYGLLALTKEDPRLCPSRRSRPWASDADRTSPPCQVRASTTKSCRGHTGHPPNGIAVERPTNNAGGLEGGITNGQDLRVMGYMKPIATLMKPLRSVDLTTMELSPAAIERSDVCAVPAAAVVGGPGSDCRWPMRSSRKFGGDSIGRSSSTTSARSCPASPHASRTRRPT